MPFYLKMTGTSSTDDARVKVPFFKKLHFSYNMKYSIEMASVCIFVCLKMFLTALIKDEHTSNDSLQSDSFFLLRNSMIAAKSLEFSYIGSSNSPVRLIICDLY